MGKDIDVSKRGPVFNGLAKRILEHAAEKAEENVAEEGASMVHSRLHRSLKHPTGYYEAHVRVHEAGPLHVVTDGDVIYGPWLEGVGSRNRTTRFKGYATFRKVGIALERKAKRIVDHTMSRACKGL